MNLAWQRLIKRKQFPAIGWMRNVEVTKGKDKTAHPHFHALLMVEPGYFGNNYLSQVKWIELWKSCLKVDYQPSMRINTIKPEPAQSPQLDNAHSGKETGLPSGLLKAIFYTIKYSNKPKDMLGVKPGNHAHIPTGNAHATQGDNAHATQGDNAHAPTGNAHTTQGDNAHSNISADAAWLLELTYQLHKTRAIALGGIFKEYMSEDDPEDLISPEDSEDLGDPDDNPEATYFWNGGNYVLPFGSVAD